MPRKQKIDWSEKNREYLVQSIGQVKGYLLEHLAKKDKSTHTASIPVPEWAGDDGESGAPALETICKVFGLSDFEKSVLTLCAGAELDAEIPKLCAKEHGSMDAFYPTFGVALAALPNPHWSALTPVSPLRRFRLVDMHGLPSTPLTSMPLKIEERVLHHLAGISYLEKQLQGMMLPVNDSTVLAESHMRIVEKILAASKGRRDKKLPSIILWGAADEESKLAVARRVCSDLGLVLWQMHASLLPPQADELESFIRLWSRESALLGAGLYLVAEDVEPTGLQIVKRLIEGGRIPGILFVGTRDRWTQAGSRSLSIEVKKPEKDEQLRIWKAYLGKSANGLEQDLGRIVSQFDLGSASIQSAAEEALISANNGGPSLEASIWDSSRAASRPKMSGLAQHIVPRARMDDLILPEKEKELLQEIAIHVRHRDKVYREWGWNNNASGRGLGIAALFAGESGTGKTMAAEVLASELNLDLFRIDLSMVVSKYIGETEKNLRQVFDAAEGGGAILFFDEADALFGKRSEIHDSHDRYANIEVGYLLQRMESYRGLAILTTNLKNAIDTAFLRRIRFVVNFPFPDEVSRAEMWRRAFPKSTPLDDLDYAKLARLNITGGSIRNIALGSCFLAAEQGVPVGMEHIKCAAKSEYDKLERPLTRVEMGGEW